MDQQGQVLEWLRQFSVEQIKEIVTLKSRKTLEYLGSIFATDPACPPMSRMLRGYSERTLPGAMYTREIMRFRKRKEEKERMSELFFQNLTVDRRDRLAFSVSKEFIGSGRLRECMLLISDEKVFHHYDAKDQSYASAWFTTSNIHIFAEWIVYLFEMEILFAYRHHKLHRLTPHPNSKFAFTELVFGKERIIAELQILAKLHTEKNGNGKFAKKTGKTEKELRKEAESNRLKKAQQKTVVIVEQPQDFGIEEIERDYILERCFQVFEQKGRDCSEIVFEYIWKDHDPKTKVFKLLRLLAELVQQAYEENERERRAIEIEQQNIEKKRKKKAKKAKRKASQEEKQKEKQEKAQQKRQNSQQDSQKDDRPQQEKQQSKLSVQEMLLSREMEKQEVFRFGQQLMRHAEEHSEFTLAKPQQKEHQCARRKPKKKCSKAVSSLSQQTNLLSRELSQLKVMSSEKQEKEELKKVRERTNQFIGLYAQGVALQSSAMDKYRRACVQLVEQALRELKFPSRWQLQVFGSYSIDFALRESDLDLLVLFDTADFTLSEIFQHLRYKEWLRGCGVTQIQSAKVSIIEFEILLVQLRHPKLKNSRVTNEVLHVDLSVTVRKTPHEGLRNTEVMKNIFLEEPKLKTVCLIFKELLRLYDFNKPFTGGIGSYVLTILIHNIIRFEKIDISQGDYMGAMLAITRYMTEYFQPSRTIISCGESTLVANSKVELNIEDPLTKGLLNTNKVRKINEILTLFKGCLELLRSVESEMLQIKVEEKKKMKRRFFELWNGLFLEGSPY